MTASSDSSTSRAALWKSEDRSVAGGSSGAGSAARASGRQRGQVPRQASCAPTCTTCGPASCGTALAGIDMQGSAASSSPEKTIVQESTALVFKPAQVAEVQEGSQEKRASKSPLALADAGLAAFGKREICGTTLARCASWHCVKGANGGAILEVPALLEDAGASGGDSPCAAVSPLASAGNEPEKTPGATSSSRSSRSAAPRANSVPKALRLRSCPPGSCSCRESSL
mmetsp:Transcript_94656/g.276744  ORF Transcript_94656/g.276744 Transcript_94656/m.276744 type:complete len:228 (-) Transcript_94656:146-829(-)